MKDKHKQTGFTLIELLVTLAVASIVVSMAVPAFTNFIKDSQIVADGNGLVADVNLARSEAIKRGVRVSVCGTANPNAAAPTCVGGTAWSGGWIVFADANANDSFDGGETLIKVGQAVSANVTIISNLNAVQYRPDGTINGNQMAYAICDDRGVTKGSQFQINILGRPRTLDADPLSCTAPAPQ